MKEYAFLYPWTFEVKKFQRGFGDSKLIIHSCKYVNDKKVSCVKKYYWGLVFTRVFPQFSWKVLAPRLIHVFKLVHVSYFHQIAKILITNWNKILVFIFGAYNYISLKSPLWLEKTRKWRWRVIISFCAISKFSERYRKDTLKSEL